MRQSSLKCIWGWKILSHQLKDNRLQRPPNHQILEIFPALFGRHELNLLEDMRRRIHRRLGGAPPFFTLRRSPLYGPLSTLWGGGERPRLSNGLDSKDVGWTIPEHLFLFMKIFANIFCGDIILRIRKRSFSCQRLSKFLSVASTAEIGFLHLFGLEIANHSIPQHSLRIRPSVNIAGK